MHINSAKYFTYRKARIKNNLIIDRFPKKKITFERLTVPKSFINKNTLKHNR